MSTDTLDPRSEQQEEERAAHEHPPDSTYIKVAIVLAVLTAIEVSTYFVEDEVFQNNSTAIVITLAIMMVMKFAIVALFFMHLKFDSKVLGRTFVFGIILAGAVYIATLTAFVFWDNSGLDSYDDPPDADVRESLERQDSQQDGSSSQG